MPFSDSVRNEALKKAHFMCVACHAPFVQVHHIIPQEEKGSNTLDNAAPLCSGCHAIYGGNPVFRKQIRQMRDNWYDVCERRFGSSAPTVSRQLNALAETLLSVRADQVKYQQSTLEEIKRLLLTSLAGTATAINRAQTLKEIPPFTMYLLPDHTVITRQECPDCGAITELNGTPPDICSVCGRAFLLGPHRQS